MLLELITLKARRSDTPQQVGAARNQLVLGRGGVLFGDVIKTPRRSGSGGVVLSWVIGFDQKSWQLRVGLQQVSMSHNSSSGP